MRKLVAIVVLVAVLGGLVASQMLAGGGYLLIAFGNYTIDMSLWTAIAVVLLFWLFYRLLKSVYRFLTSPGKKLGGLLNVRERNRSQTARGLLQYIEGRWGQAKKNLQRSAKRSEMPLVNYLAAASAAYEIGDQDEANNLLAKAQQIAPGDGLAIGLTQARMQLRDENYQQALAILRKLHSNSPSHPLVLRFLERAYSGSGDWNSLEKLLPDLKSYKVYPKPELRVIEARVYSSLLQEMSDKAEASGVESDRVALNNVWEEMPVAARREVTVLMAYVMALHQLGGTARAEELLRKRLRTHWDDDLARLYGIVEAKDGLKQLKTAESWLAQHPNNPHLLLALGRLCQRNELWGKAKDYLDGSLAKCKQPETYAELARLMSTLGEPKQSIAYYQQGLIQLPQP